MAQFGHEVIRYEVQATPGYGPKKFEQWVKTDEDGQSVLMYRVGGRDYEMVREPHCKTCNSPYRARIENQLLGSYGYTAIVRGLPEDAGLSPRNISEHVKRGHLPASAAVRRVIIEQHAEEIGLDIEGYESALGDYLTFARLGIQATIEKMGEEGWVPDFKEAVQLANILLKADQLAGENIDRELQIQAFILMREAILRFCTPEQAEAIGEFVQTHPLAKALYGRASTAIASGDVIDVEGEESVSPAMSQ